MERSSPLKILSVMKKLFQTILLSLLGSVTNAQVTIDQSDMPAVDDTFRVSVTTQVPAGYTQGGVNKTWDFSSMTPANQRVESYISVATLPAEYQFIFVLLGGANLASPGGAISFPGIPVSDQFTFFKKSATAFDDLGFGFAFSGINIPVAYDNPDRYYTFPLTYGTPPWSSFSRVNISLPGLFTYYSSRTRTSQVDGWGTLVTPFGTFQTIRVKSHLVEYDSINIDTLGTGIPITRNITEYKWLAKGEGIPVLRVSEAGGTATGVYRDIYRQGFVPVSVSLGPDTSVVRGSTITLTASVSGGVPPYNYIWDNFATTKSITVTIDSSQRFNVLVLDQANNFGIGSRVVTVIAPGISEKDVLPLQVFPNPASGIIHVRIPGNLPGGSLDVIDLRGRTVREFPLSWSAGTIDIDLGDLPSGFYFLQVTGENSVYRAKILLQPQ
jgi:hypothetical protein